MKIVSTTALDMLSSSPNRTDHAAISTARILADQAFSRAAGSPLVTGNSVRILKDAKENYPAWLEAIAIDERTIHFESYIIHADGRGMSLPRPLPQKRAKAFGLD